MTANDAAAEVPAADAPSWRELAVARSLDPARARAEHRVQRYLDAALELLNSDPGREFTVQEVVERSGQSLRGFYQYFAGKYELLLALFEESVRSTAEHLHDVIADTDDPLERVHRFAVEYYGLCRQTSKPRSTKKGPAPAAMAEFAQQLLTGHPDEASQAFIPLVSLFEELLDSAATAGAIRPGLNHRRIAGVVLQAIMFNAFATTISGASSRSESDDGAEMLWDLMLSGIGSRPPR
jgi:AcrR family transcriptional regulator